MLTSDAVVSTQLFINLCLLWINNSLIIQLLICCCSAFCKPTDLESTPVLVQLLTIVQRNIATLCKYSSKFCAWVADDLAPINETGY